MGRTLEPDLKACNILAKDSFEAGNVRKPTAPIVEFIIFLVKMTFNH